MTVKKLMFITALFTAALLCCFAITAAAQPKLSEDFSDVTQSGRDIVNNQTKRKLYTTVNSETASATVVTKAKPDDPDNKAVELKVTDATQQAYLQTTDLSTPLMGNVTVEFSILRPDTDADLTLIQLRDVLGASGTYVDNGAILKFGSDNKISAINGMDGKNVNYEPVADYQADTWYHIKMEIDPHNSCYSLYIGENKYVLGEQDRVTSSSEDGSFALRSAFKNDSIQLLRFHIINQACTVYIDDVAISQDLAIVSEGFTDRLGIPTTNILEGENVFHYRVTNNTQQPQSAVVIAAVYEKSGQGDRLVSITSQDLAFPAEQEGSYSISVNNPSGDLEKHYLRVLVWKDLMSLNPMRNSIMSGSFQLDSKEAEEIPADLTDATLDIEGEVSSVKKAYPDGKLKALTLRYDDAYYHDRTLVSKFNQYGLKGTFYVALKNINLTGTNDGTGTNPLTAAELPVLYQGHEVASHTINHLYMKDMTDTEFFNELTASKEQLEEIMGYEVTGFAYAYGDYGTDRDKTIAMVERAGYDYAVSTVSSYDFSLPDMTKPYELPFTIRHREDLLAKTDEFLALDPAEMSLFFIMGHAHEFYNDGNWELFDQFGAKIQNQPDIWYATNGEVFSYLTDMQNVTISAQADGLQITNPGVNTLYFLINDQVVTVDAATRLTIL
ncbi:MAG TPA: polysaccharide deacetylase family protein [Candidatus Aphodoplasma excrementigallinarum]|uniref:Polysaccharide deacetylase family protein n=1 Tax=Candidatus Aphodoplasma excrementigallinarum TaxID=2840673 RepID=A0A9D1T019_9FIRM|nr:polysaccharide deacetylase family protein [Candidatus Aphodoplasma excrementigallinarum]